LKKRTKKPTATNRTKKAAKPGKKKAGKSGNPESRKARKPALVGEAALSPKQLQFVIEYLGNGFNATRAAIAAGYAKAHADTQGSRLLANAKVAAVLAARTRKITEKREITAERVLDEIAKLAYRDPRKLFRMDGTLVPVHELDEENASAIAGIEVIEREDGSRLKKIRLEKRSESLLMLGRYLKLFTDKVEHSGSLGVQLITTVPRPQRQALSK
jgi:phage terminase small subunit